MFNTLKKPFSYVTFHAEASLTLESSEKIKKINQELTEFLPPRTYDPSENFHVTLGESTYIDQQTGITKKIKMEEEVATKIAIDHETILNNFEHNLSQATVNGSAGYAMTEFAVMENGYFAARLAVNDDVNTISQCYKTASQKIDSQIMDVSVALKKHYQPEDAFNMHVTLGKFRSPKTICNYTSQSEYLNVNLFNTYKTQTIHFTERGNFVATFRGNRGQHVELASGTFPLQSNMTTVLPILHYYSHALEKSKSIQPMPPTIDCEPKSELAILR